MTPLHGWLAILLVAADLAVLGAAVALAGRMRMARIWLDRAMLAALAIVAVDALVGLALIATGHAPSDLLHVVYAAVSLLVLPVVRWAGRSGDLRRRGLWVAAGSGVLLGVVLRLAQTG